MTSRATGPTGRRALLLDVMGTLVHDPFHAGVPALFGLDLPTYFSQKNRQAYLDFECGRIDAPTYARRMFTDGRPVELDALERWYRAHYRWLDGIDALLDRLTQTDIELHALSNYGAFWQWIEDELGVSDRVPWTFVSARTGLRKPATACYAHAALSLGLEPDRCWFVDDREKNCEGARTVGMHAHRFTDAASLQSWLETQQLL